MRKAFQISSIIAIDCDSALKLVMQEGFRGMYDTLTLEEYLEFIAGTFEVWFEHRAKKELEKLDKEFNACNEKSSFYKRRVALAKVLNDFYNLKYSITEYLKTFEQR